MHSTGATLGQDCRTVVCSTAGWPHPRLWILEQEPTWLGPARLGPCFPRAAPLECSVIDPRSLGNLLFQPSNVRTRAEFCFLYFYFFDEQYSITIVLFPPPLLLREGKGSSFSRISTPPLLSSRVEPERSSGRFDTGVGRTPQRPASFTPHELKLSGLIALRIGGSSSAVQSTAATVAAAVGITKLPLPTTTSLERLIRREENVHTRHHAVETCRQESPVIKPRSWQKTSAGYIRATRSTPFTPWAGNGLPGEIESNQTRTTTHIWSHASSINGGGQGAHHGWSPSKSCSSTTHLGCWWTKLLRRAFRARWSAAQSR